MAPKNHAVHAMRGVADLAADSPILSENGLLFTQASFNAITATYNFALSHFHLQHPVPAFAIAQRSRVLGIDLVIFQLKGGCIFIREILKIFQHLL